MNEWMKWPKHTCKPENGPRERQIKDKKNENYKWSDTVFNLHYLRLICSALNLYVPNQINKTWF